MKRTLYLALVIACVFSAQLCAQGALTDTLWIDSVVTHSGQQTILEINFFNAAPVKGIDLPLKYSSPDIVIDSVSFIGSRGTGILIPIANIDPVSSKIQIAMVNADPASSNIPAGYGLFARIFAYIPDEYPSRIVTFDTTSAVTSFTFVSETNQGYVPTYKKGYIDNTYSPATADSVWIDDLTVTPGQSFVVPLYADNDRPVQYVTVPLSYQSDNIVFDSMKIDGLRSENAISFDAIADDDQKNVLVTLDYASDNLLDAGSGPIANLYFSAAADGTSTTVTLDTTTIDVNKLSFQLGDLHGGLIIFPDYYAGTITVDVGTDVDIAADALPATFSLAQNQPNPFNPTTAISFSLPKKDHVQLKIFNILGQCVRTLVDSDLPAGTHTLIFDGLDDNQKTVASGIYMYRISTTDNTASRKMVMLK